jgi:tetratricopeptide (TPR) repeat protein
MPQRPRSHQLEDISRRRFRDLLPAAWVCRDKDQDYGVDLEVEVFNQEGIATGHTFNVQLKATDSLAGERSVQMDTDRIRYLSSLDAPAIFARYCSVTDTTRWRWIFNAFDGADLSTKTLTLNFDDDDIWDEGTPPQIEETLRVLRRLRSADRRIGFPLVPVHQSSTGEALIVEHAIEEVCSALPYCRARSDLVGAIPIKVVTRPGELGLMIDVVASFQFRLEKLEQEEVVDCTLYGLAAILDHYSFRDQAVLAAQSCLRRGRPSHSRALARAAASCLENAPLSAVDLAVLNGIHEEQDAEYSRFLMGILSSEVSTDEKSAAVQIFFRHAIKAHEGSSTVGAIYYSLGNSLSHIGRKAAAIGAFNRARKVDPGYLERPYFLAEVGGALYLSGRFRPSARAYAAALRIAPSSRILSNLGDALFFSGQLDEISEIFGKLTSDADEMLASNARLKLWLRDWYSARDIPVGIADGHGWARFVEAALEVGDPDTALQGQLVIAFLGEWDTDVWADAILLSASMPALLPDVLLQAYRRCGNLAYQHFRAKAAGIGVPTASLAELDDLALAVHGSRAPAPHEGLTVRLLGEPSFDYPTSTQS